MMSFYENKDDEGDIAMQHEGEPDLDKMVQEV